MKWLEDLMPDNEQWVAFSKNLGQMTASVANAVQIGEYALIISKCMKT